VTRSQPIDLLVFGAHPPSLRGFRPHLGDALDGEIRGLRVSAKAVGVGMAAAGSSAAKRIFRLQPRAVLLVGTCGVYPGLPEYQPYDILIPTRMQLVDHTVISGLASFPGPMQTTVPTNAPLVAGLQAGGPRVRAVPVACTLAETTDDNLAQSVPDRTGCHAECLEGAAVAHACALAEIPFAASLGITHVVGSYGHEDWRKFERQASITAAEIIVNWIHTGAQGLPHRR